MNKNKKMSIEDTIEGILKLGNFTIKKQPETAQQELLDLENKYGITTIQMLKGVNKEGMTEEVINRWINTYQTYLDFGGE